MTTSACCLSSSANVVPHRVEYDLHAFPTGEFEGGHKIRIAGRNDHGPHHFAERKARDVQANTHIDALLLDSQVKVIVGQLARRLYQISGDVRFDAPFVRHQGNAAHTKGHIPLQYKLVIQCLRQLELVVVAKSSLLPEIGWRTLSDDGGAS